MQSAGQMISAWRVSFSVSAFAMAACGASSSSPPLTDTSNDGGTSDGATQSGQDAAPDASSSDASDSGTPITAAADQWTWVDFPDSKCASGSPTGLAVNPHSGATDLIIYLEGGGACTDADSCWGASPAANNLSTYDATTFANASQVRYPLLNRSFADNPVAAMNMVYVPYCTGDMHGGSTETTFTEDGGSIPTYFWGANDIDVFLTRLVPTFATTKHVWLFGTSAGGFGAMLNFDRVAKAFGVRVDILDDSGPPIAPMGVSDNAGLFNVWGYVAPAGCTGCNSLRDIYDFDRREQPNSRYGFLSFAEDTTISVRFGYTPATFPPIVDGFSSSIASDPNAATYIVTNEQSHVVESDVTLAPHYLPWITAMLTDATWADATYAHP